MLQALLRVFRPASRRARFQRWTSSTPSAELLECRQLLTATVLQTVNDMMITADDSGTVILADHFDDPDVTGSVARIDTPLGAFHVETFDRITPVTTANFLTLIDEGRYADMFFHRRSADFVLQGGGFTYAEDGTGYDNVSNNGTIVNEFENWFDANLGGLQEGTPLNLRGTIAMAKLGGDPDSATSQWFVNLSDNASQLDPQNGGFTVFAQVLFDGMDVVDDLVALPTINAGVPFSELPVRDYSGAAIVRDNLLTTTTTRVNELAYEVTVNSNPQVVTTSIVDGALRITPVTRAAGVATLTLVATDLQGQSRAQTFDVTVTDGTIPMLLSPIGDDRISRPEFRWTTPAGATSYELWVNHVGVQNRIILESDLSTPVFTPADSLPDGNYKAWVRARDAEGMTGEWSDAIEFRIGESVAATVGVPTLTGPLGTTDILQPTLEWTATEGADFYDLWVNQLGGTAQIIRQTNLTTTSFQPVEDLPSGSYRAWVQARTGTVAGAWSDALTFVISGADVPVVVGPETFVDDGVVTISWTYPVTTDTRFEVWVNQIGGQERIVHNTNVSGNSLTVSSALPPGRHRVWVRDVTPGQPRGQWSPSRDFTVVSTNTPGDVSGITVQADTARPTISWNAAQNAARYELWVNHVGGQTRIIHDQNITATQFVATEVLSAGTYRLWIRALNSDFVGGGWSEMITFTIA